MTRRPLVALVTLPLLLAGCGAGLHAQTYQPRPAADATNTSIHAIAIRNLAVVAPADSQGYPVGADARVQLALVNQGTQNDQLIAVTTDAAGQVVLLDQGSAQNALPIPAGGSAGISIGLLMHGLTRPLRSGDYVTMHLEFAVNGGGNVLVPVAIATGAAAVQATVPDTASPSPS